MRLVKKNKSTWLIIALCIVSLVTTLSSVQLIASSVISVEDGVDTYSMMAPYPVRATTKFEDSDVFSDMFRRKTSEITRMCVIRNQMEKNGRYDPTKPVDITAYANRANDFANSSDKLTAMYAIDDLIKWGNYGFDYQVVSGTEAQLDSYFYAISEDLSSAKNAGEVYHCTAEQLMSDLHDYTAEDEVMYILVPRYSTIDGDDLIKHAANRAEYATLIMNLCVSADALFSNYGEYSTYIDEYNSESTNVMYCYQMVDANGKSVRYSNIGKNIGTMSNDDISELFTSKKKYVCYNPDKMQLSSNIDGVGAVYMRDIVDKYRYSFGDGSRIWLAIDDAYPIADAFNLASKEYSELDSSFPVMCIVDTLSIIAYIILLIIVTILAGKSVYEDEDGTRVVKCEPSKVDRISIELWLIVTFCVGFMLMCMFGSTYAVLHEQYKTIDLLAYFLYGVEVVIINAIMLPLYLIFVRKFKCKLLWKTSWLERIVRKIKAIVIEAYDNGKLIFRVWVPYLLFLLVNLILVLLGGGGIIAALVIDAVVGWYRYKESKVRDNIVKGITQISNGDFSYQVKTEELHGDNLTLANAVNNIGTGIRNAVSTSMKDEKMKTDLITNVSHDIKTPLTSIINFVDLLKRENIQDEKVRGYIDVLDQKSQRLKALINDLVEASKISSGNITLNVERINLGEFVNQSIGEYADKFEEKALKVVFDAPEEQVCIMADSKGLFRVIENLYTNIYKYALEHTRVYIGMTCEDGYAVLSLKNISEDPLNISSEELLERFTRGDESRKTEGSGLGLSIAKSMVEAMHGTFDVLLDGDLFKVIISFKAV